MSGAVRLLSSRASLAPYNDESVDALQQRHPSPHENLQLPPSPDVSTPGLEVCAAVIEKSIRSFNPGSAAGPDRLSPQHLKELISKQTGEAGAHLLDALTALSNTMLAGAIPDSVCPVLYGANLLALNKPGGGIRPIAVGNVFRRLVAKSVVRLVGEEIGVKLRPTQLGFGTPGGCEAAIHATRRYLSQAGEILPRVLLKLDYKNAFNTIRRDYLLRVVRKELPQLYPLVWQFYSSPTKLFFGTSIIQSATGVQQGDPLGPALFSMSIMDLLHRLTAQLNIWYLDDGTLGGSSEEVFADFKSIIDHSPSLGLELNLSKCELFIAGMPTNEVEETLAKFRSVAPAIQQMQCETASLLGAPLTTAAMPLLLQEKTAALENMVSRLHLLQAHDAVYLLRNCFAIPKMLHLLRTSPTWKATEELARFDCTVRQALQDICNIRLDDTMWSQASLPTSKGGLGVRQAVDLTLPAFLSSTHATKQLVLSLLPEAERTEDALIMEAMALWSERADCEPPPDHCRARQQVWDGVLTDKVHQDLLETTSDPCTTGRLLATATKESGAWLNALPVPHLGTKLDNNSVRIAIGLRLGADIVEEHQCVCGALVTRKGTHGLSCRRSGGRISRHHSANETIRRALVSGGVPSVLEPVGVCREDAKRPDGMTLIPWEGGRALLWDFTCSDTLAPSNRSLASRGTARVACAAEELKRRKYASLTTMYHFSPVCIESLGAWGEAARTLIRQIGSRVRESTGDPRATSFLTQKLSLDVQRGNVASIMATLPSTRDWGEFGLLPVL